MNQTDWEVSIQKVSVVVGCVVKRDNKYLLVKENPDGKVVYSLPAGHVDKDEQLETAAIRETKEETGYDVKLRNQLKLYHETAPQSVKHVYEAEIIGGEEQAQEGEILEVVWRTFDEIAALESDGELRAPWVFDAVQTYENTLVNGHIIHDRKPERQDFLFRVSLKAVIMNDKNHVLVVKETDRDWWDLPGGGMDHGESIQQALARELHEEVSLTGDFTHRILRTEEPSYTPAHNLYQLRLVFAVAPENLDFAAGEDGDEVMFVDPATFKNSERLNERLVYEYSVAATQ